MEELSLHILDLVQNSLGAGATWVKIEIKEEMTLDLFTLVVTDNGRGMSREFLEQVLDPFATSRTTRRVGMGLALLDMAARQCKGRVKIDSILGRGTRVEATFQHSHWDRAPLGDMKATLLALITANPQLHLEYEHQVDGCSFTLDTREVQAILGDDIPLNNMTVLSWLEEYLVQGLTGLYGGEGSDKEPEES